MTEFLTGLFEQGLEYSTINGYRSAISAIHPPIDGHSVGKHPIITQIMAGVFNERPPVPKYTDTWDVAQVLTYLKSKGSNNTMDTKDLTHKLAMLLAVTSASRASELQALNIKHMTNIGSQIKFSLNKPIKTTKQGNAPHTITFRKYESDDSLNVIACLETYLVRTSDWRLSEE